MAEGKNTEQLRRKLKLAVMSLMGALGLWVLLMAGVIYLISFYKQGHKVTENALKKEMLRDAPVEKPVETALSITDSETGLIIDAHWQTVKATCTACHTADLVIQNRATREGWEGMIRWMQRTQNLWDLGENEAAILDYLSKNYAPENKGRRAGLGPIEWHEQDAAQ